jgi:hypothetical protein
MQVGPLDASHGVKDAALSLRIVPKTHMAPITCLHERGWVQAQLGKVVSEYEEQSSWPKVQAKERILRIECAPERSKVQSRWNVPRKKGGACLNPHYVCPCSSRAILL